MYATAILLNTTLPFLHHEEQRSFHRKLSDVHNRFLWTEYWLPKKSLKMSAVVSSLHIAFQRSSLKHKSTFCTHESDFLSTYLVSWRNLRSTALTENGSTIPNLTVSDVSGRERRQRGPHFLLSPAFPVVSNNNCCEIRRVNNSRASPTTHKR